MNLPNAEGDLLESQPAPIANPVKELEASLEALKRLFLVAMFGVIFLALSVNVYLLRQTREALRRFAEARNVVTHYEQVQKPFIQNFAGSLQLFAKTYPDFQPIVDRYVPQQPVSNPPPTLTTPSLRTPPPTSGGNR
jgi:hypothetical protein